MKPMLACHLVPHKVKFPALAGIKHNGIRVILKDGEAITRNFKPIPNEHIRAKLKHIHGFEGEIILRGSKDFESVSSAVMSQEGEPDFHVVLFDCFLEPNLGYRERLAKCRDLSVQAPSLISVVSMGVYTSIEDLEAFYLAKINLGEEGIIVRSMDGKYKYGRATANESTYLKWKPNLSEEVNIVGFNEKFHNGGEVFEDELGRPKRTSHKENMVPLDTLGSLLVEDSEGRQFKVGVGWSDALGRELWAARMELLGKSCTINFKERTKIGVPKSCSFGGIRSDI